MSELADEYRLEYFEEEGFVRKECPEWESLLDARRGPGDLWRTAV